MSNYKKIFFSVLAFTLFLVASSYFNFSQLLKYNLAQLSGGATIYYVDDVAGDDLNPGTSQDKAWKTISKVNNASFSPGDQILFKRGGVWREQLTIPSSGTSGNPITFGAYGSGERPIISGADTVTGWTQYQGNIYVADVGSITAPNQLYVDGQYIDIAHYPNSGWLFSTADSADGNTITAGDLTLSQEQLVGAGIMAKALTYRVIPSTIASYNSSSHIMSLSPALYSTMKKDWGFYLQNKLWMLDSAKEWFYDSSTGKIYLWTTTGDNPNDHTVEISKYQYAVYVNRKNYITIQDLEIGDAANSNVMIEGADSVTVNNLDIKDGLNGIKISAGSSNCLINNNLIQDPLENGILAGAWWQSGKVVNLEIKNNNISNVGTIGMPRTSSASIAVGNYATDYSRSVNVYNNTINNSGYIGIWFTGDQINVQNNNINNSCLVLDDCGGIYTSSYQNVGGTIPTNNTVIGNTVSNTMGNCEGTSYRNNCYTIATGIYLDAITYTTKILNNTVTNADHGIFSNDGHDNIVTGNKIYSARRYAIGWVAGSFPAATDQPKNNIIKNNLLETISKNYSFYIQNNFTKNAVFGIYDNNKYCHSNSNNIILTNLRGQPGEPGYNPNNKLTATFYTNFSAWQGYSKQDENSTETTSSCYGQEPPTPLPDCGDGTCNSNETCSSCPSDCGACIDEPGTFSLSISSTNGTVSKNPNQTTFEKGTNVILTANPNQGYKFKNWSGDASGSANPLTLTMTSAKTVTANFVKIEEEIEDEKKEEALIKAIIPPTSQFTKDLKLKDTNNDVLMLQQFLNNNGFTISVKGYGSKGNETIYFGAATQNALNKFQTQFLDKIGISSPTGYLDAKTRAFINLKVVSNTETDTTTTTPTTPISSSIPSDFKFSSTLKYGQNSQDILYLQKILNSDPYTRIAKTGVGSWGKETIHFGAATRAAVIKFQEKYAKEILTPSGLTRGTGTVGAATIKKLNQIVESRNY
jgi:parallel beta-helix repeat protein